jgi:hypothetical protein
VRLVMRGAPLMVGLLVRKDSPIKTVHDVKGKRFTGEYRAHLAVWYNMFGHLSSAGLTWNDVKVVPVNTVNDGVGCAAAEPRRRHPARAQLGEGQGGRRRGRRPAHSRRLLAGRRGAHEEGRPGLLPARRQARRDHRRRRGHLRRRLRHVLLRGQGPCPIRSSSWRSRPCGKAARSSCRSIRCSRSGRKDRAVDPERRSPTIPARFRFYKERGAWKPGMDQVPAEAARGESVVDEVLPKFRSLSGAARAVEGVVLVAVTVAGGRSGRSGLQYHLPVPLFNEQYLGLFLGLGLAGAFIVVKAYPAAPQGYVPWYDWICAACALGIGLYITILYPSISYTLSSLAWDRLVPAAARDRAGARGDAPDRGLGAHVDRARLRALRQSRLAPARDRSTRRARAGAASRSISILDSSGILGVPLGVTASIVVAYIFFGQALTGRARRHVPDRLRDVGDGPLPRRERPRWPSCRRASTARSRAARSRTSSSTARSRSR